MYRILYIPNNCFLTFYVSIFGQEILTLPDTVLTDSSCAYAAYTDDGHLIDIPITVTRSPVNFHTFETDCISSAKNKLATFITSHPNFLECEFEIVCV